MSRKGMEPSGLDSSFVNWMWWSIELRWFRELSTCDDFMMVSVSSKIFSRMMVGSVQTVWPWFPCPPYRGLQQLG